MQRTISFALTCFIIGSGAQQRPTQSTPVPRAQPLVRSVVPSMRQPLPPALSLEEAARYSTMPIQKLQKLVGIPAPAVQIQFVDKEHLNKSPAEVTKGKIVVLDLWATWCPPCRAALPKLSEMTEKLAGNNAIIVGACDPTKSSTLGSFLPTIKYPVGVARNFQAIMQYLGVNSIPQICIIGTDGKIVVPGCRLDKVEEVVALLSRRAAASQPGKIFPTQRR